MIDCHIHSTFSHDGKSEPEDIVLRAIALGMDYICFAEHCDKDVLFFVDDIPQARQLDVEAYYNGISALVNKYSDRIKIGIGIECGYYHQANDLYADILSRYRFDAIINSIHVVSGLDPYHQKFYALGDAKYCYDVYLDQVIESLDAPYPYDIVAHLTYISRYAPYADYALRYVDHAQKLDELFSKIISKGKCLEFNSHCRTHPAEEFFDYRIYERYYEMGGRKLSFGSDAHVTDRVGDKYDAVTLRLNKIGFDQWTCYHDGKECVYGF